MIYTVTCNPSLDYVISVDKFCIGITNRSKSEQILPGGKGLNVSIVLQHLGIESTALGFLGGFTGEEIAKKTKTLGIFSQWIMLKDECSRINVKLNGVSDLEKTLLEGTEINASGPTIPLKALESLKDILKKLQSGDILVLAGSIPSSMPSSLYEQLIACVADRGVLTVVDAAGNLLKNILPLHPFLIKPNKQELEELFQVKIQNKKDVVVYARQLQKMGARNVLVSLGGEGAVLVAEDDNIHMADAPKGKLVNSVGAGDSMVAGFLAGWLKNGNYKDAFYMGLATGSATAFSQHLASKEKIEEVYQTII